MRHRRRKATRLSERPTCTNTRGPLRCASAIHGFGPSAEEDEQRISLVDARFDHALAIDVQEGVDAERPVGGRARSVRTSSRNAAGVRTTLPRHPHPPAFDTATASAGPAPGPKPGRRSDGRCPARGTEACSAWPTFTPVADMARSRALAAHNISRLCPSTWHGRPRGSALASTPHHARQRDALHRDRHP